MLRLSDDHVRFLYLRCNGPWCPRRIAAVFGARAEKSKPKPLSFRSGVAASLFRCLLKKLGGGGEIRTHEAFRPSGFQDRRDQPLCHPSQRMVISDAFAV